MDSKQRDTWQKKGNLQRQERFARDLRRVAIVLTLVVLGGVLVRYLFPPFFAPQTHLVLLGSGINANFHTPSIPYVAEDRLSLEAVDSAVIHDQSEAWKAARSAKRLGEVIRKTGLRRSDTLLVYLTAHGVSDDGESGDGEAYLLCDNFDLRRPDSGRVKVETLLSQLSESPAEVKVLLLNAGMIDRDPRMGMVVNEFPRLLEEAVRKTGDPSLWVFCSHSSLQYSHISRAARRSVFGLFVTEGLKGAADFNSDSRVDLGELASFASANVAHWVRRTSDRGAEQTPLLMWGGVGDIPDSTPLLVTCSGGVAPGEFDIADFLYHGDEQAEDAPLAQRGGRSTGILTRHQLASSSRSPTLAATSTSAAGTSLSIAPSLPTGPSLRSPSITSPTMHAPSTPSMSAPTAVGVGSGRPLETGGTGLAGSATGAGGGQPSSTESSDSAAKPADAPKDGDAPTPAGGTTAPEGPASSDGSEAADPASTSDGGPESEGESTEKRDRFVRPRQLLADAWHLRDQSAQLWSVTNPSASPVENVPHLWREFEAELLGFDQRLRAGSGVDPTTIESILESIVSSRPPQAADGRSPIAFLWESTEDLAANRLQFAPGRVHSVALARLIAQQQHQRLGIDLSALYAAFQQDSRKELDEWMAKNWHQDHAAYSELRFLKRLVDTTGLPWNLLQIAAQARFSSERVAALDLLSPGWTREKVDNADQHRCFAEELIFDRVGNDWRERARQGFESAVAFYSSAESDFVEIRSAEYLRDTVIDKTPHYLAWLRRTGGRSNGARSGVEDISSLLGTLAELVDRLGDPKIKNVVDVASLARNLQRLRTRVESAASDASIERFVDRAPTLGDAWRAEQVLETPLLSATSRQTLLAVADGLARELAAGFLPAKVTSSDLVGQGRGDGESAGQSAQPSLAKWEFLFASARLESMFVGITGADRGQAPGQGVRMGDDRAEVMRALDALGEAHRAVIAAYGKNQQMPLAAAATVDTLWIAYRRFGTAVESAYLADSIPLDGETLCEESQARTASRALRRMDPRDAWRAERVDVESLSAAARIQTTLRWQAKRLEQASVYRKPAESRLLLEQAATYRIDSATICQQVASSIPRPSLAVNGPSMIDLQYRSSHEFSVDFQNSGSKDVSISLDYDHDLIQLTRAVDDSNNSPLDGNLTNPSSGFRADAPSFIRIAAGQHHSSRFRLLRRGRASQSTRIVIDAREETQSGLENRRENDAAIDRSDRVGGNGRVGSRDLLARKRIDVLLPVGEIFVQQSGSSVISDDTTWKLNPYPNRVSQFKFGVVNQSSAAKRISVGLYALAEPFGSRTIEDHSTHLAGQKALTEFKMVVPGNGVPVFPAAETEAKKESKPEAGGEPPVADAPPADDANAPAAAPVAIKTTPLKHGLLAVLTDTDSGQTTLRHLGFSIQRPRRFLRPHVRFNAYRSRIEVEVTAPAPSLVPAGDAVRVRCRLANSLPGGIQGKLQGQIKSPSFHTNLFINVPSPPPQFIRLYVDVDDYPRAFIFDVPCGKHTANVPEVIGLQEVRLKASSLGGFRAATHSISVAMELDVPVGSFENGDDLVELGIDFDATGTSDPESSVRLHTDRSVSVGFVDALPDGTVNLHASVSDFTVDLPVGQLQNVGVDVAAKITVKKESRQIPPIELFIDTAPPIVGPVQPTNHAGFVPVNSSLEISAWAWDAGSGVKQVEAVFDVTGSGEFPAKGKFVQATRVSDREWALVIAAGEKPGPQTLLVRGVDRVGNHSDPVRMSLEIVSLTEGKARVKQQTVEIAGSVIFRDEFVPGAEVRLIAISKTAEESDGEAHHGGGSAVVVQTKPNGRYSITGVPPGDYVLNARGVIRNRVRRMERKIVVAAGPQRTVQVDVDLP